jgi:hypothetical protein
MAGKSSRRDFLKDVGAASAAAYLALDGGPRGRQAAAANGQSIIFQAPNCPVPSGTADAHEGLDVLLYMMSRHGHGFYKTTQEHPWGGLNGLIDKNDIVLIKINCQWKFRGATNTDVLRGLIYRILNHPDGFSGEVVIFENGQGQGAFHGDPIAWGRYPQIGAPTGVHVNAEDDTLTVDRLVGQVFAGAPVTSFLLDSVRSTFISTDDHTTNGYRRISDVSYPCFTTSRGTRVELKEGIWTGSGHTSNIKFINLPVLKTHDGTGITGVLKHMYGVVSMTDGSNSIRHYSQSGTQCGKMWTLVRAPDLNIVDCIWVTYAVHHCGWPPSTTWRYDMLMAGFDPVALDYWGSKHLLYPLGGDRQQYHNPDADSGLINHLIGARDTINAAGGINGQPTVVGDGNIRVISPSDPLPTAARNWDKY